MYINNVKVFNFEGAIRGMRNPLDSWDKSDSKFGIGLIEDISDAALEVAKSYGDDDLEETALWLEREGILQINDACGEYAFIGKNDLRLMHNLIRGGGEHRKFMRQIMVSMDICAPRFFWSEFDTYHFNTKNSCSTMHTLLNRITPITEELFDGIDEEDADVMAVIINRLEKLRQKFQTAKSNGNEKAKRKLLLRAKKLLPEDFLQLRTVTTSYEEIYNMLKQREYHQLPHWHQIFVDRMMALPYAYSLFLGLKKEENTNVK